ncbi:MAG: CPBP family intramembrane metalloprotease, partial [Planctomycetes bacterium]|nr:CPBP family intramembrane metalloprotease [Planctomycetota bacterium]
YTRIKRLYVKEILDILRDRRALIAMIVVPIVLYPLLMLGSIQAASLQAGKLKEKPLIIGVQTHGAAQSLAAILREDAERAARRQAKADEEGVKIGESAAIEKFQIIVVERQNLEEWVRTSEVADCGVMFDPLPLPPNWQAWQQQVHAEVVADSAEIGSWISGARLRNALKRHGRLIVKLRNDWEGRPEWYINPMVVDEVDVATAEKRGGGMLGQILPLILILMTITGSIYPAIDLTAGERERGTLETLMVCPIPVVEIIIGKFLVVSSVALSGAALNLCSMGLTLQFGGFNEALAAGAETAIPTRVLPVILLFLIPLAVLFSALMLAVCSFARTFKEAQNYVTPVIVCALVPAGLAAMPGTELEGVWVVMPVANMVLLTRELLLGNADAGTILIALLSTCLYAFTAVAVAVRVFGQEAVMFADSGSWRAQFDRRMIRPSTHPKPTLALMYVALLFPAWFYIQGGLGLRSDDFAVTVVITQILMILCFALLPIAVVMYYKVDVRNSFSLRVPRLRYLLAAVLIGLSTWALTHELIMVQLKYGLFGITEEVLKSSSEAGEQLLSLSPLVALFLLALVPGISEELLFRGLFLNGLRTATRKWPAIIAVAVTFSVYHYVIQRFVVTVSLGILLAYLCWQARSVFPAMIAHIMHNGIQLLLGLPATGDRLSRFLRIPTEEDTALAHLPSHIVVPAAALLILAIALCRRESRPGAATDGAPSPEGLERSDAVGN